jgi:cytolysin (calcineurin-like family phosphatase)
MRHNNILGQLCIALQYFVTSALLSTFEKNPFSLKFRLLYNLHQGTEEPHFHVCVLCKGKGKALQKSLPKKDTDWYRQEEKPML